jgi:NhaP-type Na+/H+ or K+/H+ antiporter
MPGSAWTCRSYPGRLAGSFADSLSGGVPITWVFGAIFAALLFGMSHRAAIMLGAILVVSEPTVVLPLLRFIRPTEKLQEVLAWEGSLIDPVGGILGAVVYAAALTGTRNGPFYLLGQFLASVGIGLVGAAVGIALLWFLLLKLRLGGVLGTSVQLACVIGVAAACDLVRDDAGLVAAVLMGLALANSHRFDVPARRPFFETVVQLTIGLLFVSISATVTPRSLEHLVLPTLGLVAVLVLVTRALVAFLTTVRSDLIRGERQFTGWMARRGIVAAATASTFSAGLISHHTGRTGTHPGPRIRPPGRGRPCCAPRYAGAGSGICAPTPTRPRAYTRRRVPQRRR